MKKLSGTPENQKIIMINITIISLSFKYLIYKVLLLNTEHDTTQPVD